MEVENSWLPTLLCALNDGIKYNGFCPVRLTPPSPSATTPPCRSRKREHPEVVTQWKGEDVADLRSVDARLRMYNTMPAISISIVPADGIQANRAQDVNVSRSSCT